MPTGTNAAYGQGIASSFHFDAAPTLVTRNLRAAQIAVTRLTCDGRGVGKTLPMPPERAYIVSVQLRHLPGAELWLGDRIAAQGPVAEGSVGIVYLEHEPTFNILHAFDSLMFYIPTVAFDELAHEEGGPRIREFAFQYAALDPIMHQLGRALLPALADGQRCGRLFFEHLSLAMYSHLAATYGKAGHTAPTASCALSAWQERTAKALLTADLVNEPSIAEVARACGLPTGRFIRAFRHSMDAPPYRWLRQFRVERAQTLLLNSSLSLSQIAYECGFADQSHLTRVFSQSTGMAPGAWRKARRSSIRTGSSRPASSGHRGSIVRTVGARDCLRL